MKKKTKTISKKTGTSSIVANILESIKKEFKDDNIVSTASDMTEYSLEGIKRIPTGDPQLDVDLGGGIPIGRVIHISGEYSSTKSTQSLHMLRNAQQMGLPCALMDFENTLDNAYLQQLGIDTDDMVYSNPSSLEEVAQLMQSLQEKGIKFIIWDSVAVAEPTKVLESDTGDSVQMGVKQKLIGEFLGKFQSINNRFTRNGEMPCTLILINQVREKIGAYGDPEYEPGGRAVGFYTSVHIRFRKGDWIAEGTGNNKEIVGQVVKYKIVKNKTYKRMVSGEFDFYQVDSEIAGVKEGYNDTFKSAIMLALSYNLVTRGGAWFYIDKGLDTEKKFQGLEKLIEYFRANPELIDKYKEQILEIERRAKE